MKKGSDWAFAVIKLGLTPIFVGNNLKNYSDDRSAIQNNASTPIYLSLLFVTEDIWSVGLFKDDFLYARSSWKTYKTGLRATRLYITTQPKDLLRKTPPHIT